MVDFNRSAATAKRLIEKNGRQIKVYKSNRTADDSAQPWRGSTTRPNIAQDGAGITLIAAFVPATSTGFGSLGFGKALRSDTGLGALETDLDQVCLVASDSIPAQFTPKDVEEADTLIDDDDTVWRIVDRAHLRPASKSVMFSLGLKR